MSTAEITGICAVLVAILGVFLTMRRADMKEVSEAKELAKNNEGRINVLMELMREWIKKS